LFGGFAVSFRIRSFVVPALALVIVSFAALGLARPAGAATCWQRVISDWRDGHIDGTYSPRCLRAALDNMPEDIRVYGSAEEDITRLLNASQARQFAAATSPAHTGAATGTTTTHAAEPAAGSRSLSGCKPKTRPAPAHPVAAAAERATGAGFPYRTLLLILAAASAVSVVALASARGLRG
jgi:hypothetical protein